MSQEGAEAREGVMQRERFAESDLYTEIQRSLGEVETRIDRLIERHGCLMSEAEVDAFLEIDRLLYDVVLELARLEARELTPVRLTL